MKKIFVPFLLLLATAIQAQKVTGKLSFQTGQKLEVTTTQNSTAETPMGENASGTVSTDVYEVKSVSPSGATLERSTKKIKMNLSIMGQEKTVDSDNPEDLKGMLGEPIKNLLSTKNEFTVDAAGMVTAVAATDKKKSTDNGMASMFMQQTNPAANVLKPGAPSFFKFLPPREVGTGDSWTDSTSAEGIASATTYTVKEITGTEIFLNYTGDGRIDTKREMMGMSMDVKGTIKSSGTVTLDKATGLLKQKTDTMLTETAANLNGQAMNVKAKVTSVTNVRPL